MIPKDLPERIEIRGNRLTWYLNGREVGQASVRQEALKAAWETLRAKILDMEAPKA